MHQVSLESTESIPASLLPAYQTIENKVRIADRSGKKTGSHLFFQLVIRGKYTKNTYFVQKDFFLVRKAYIFFPIPIYWLARDPDDVVSFEVEVVDEQIESRLRVDERKSGFRHRMEVVISHLLAMNHSWP